MIIDLTEMDAGELGVISEVQGGHDMARRLQSMGVRPGKRIKKVSSHFWRGPQTVEIDKAQVAIGFSMATKIFIEVQR
ncbi:MAG: ferrous iron transport protein A [Candidatus Omnitrophica bacterium]|nr:ferrous iron transport protein A [Candidatus Omnitrophota bacterium]